MTDQSGNKENVRWAALTNDNGVGLLIVGNPEVSVCALHHSTDDLQGPMHTYEIPYRDEIYLNIDYHQMGVGGDNSWGARPHPEFTLYADSVYTYSFRLSPISKSQSAMGMSKVLFPTPPTVPVPDATGHLQSTADSILFANGFSIVMIVLQTQFDKYRVIRTSYRADTFDNADYESRPVFGRSSPLIIPGIRYR